MHNAPDIYLVQGDGVRKLTPSYKLRAYPTTEITDQKIDDQYWCVDVCSGLLINCLPVYVDPNLSTCSFIVTGDLQIVVNSKTTKEQINSLEQYLLSVKLQTQRRITNYLEFSLSHRQLSTVMKIINIIPHLEQLPFVEKVQPMVITTLVREE